MSDESTPAARLTVGDTAPTFTLPDADGTPVSLESLRGGRVILYFYPAAGTPGCTTQACDFRDNLGSLERHGFMVLGISKDSPADLARFRDEHGLPFRLLSDEDLAVHTAYGTWGEKTLYGKKVDGVIRSTIVLDEHGNVILPWYNVRATGHVASLGRKLGVA